jgi:N-glycosylase/DNA lyase
VHALGPVPKADDASESVAVGEFDLAATLDSGQVFHWQRADDGFVGLIDRTPVFVSQPSSDRLLVTAGQSALVSRYFALDHDLDAIRRTFPAGDPVLERAIRFCPGLRLIRQPVWECLATFITSSLKQVAHILKISQTIRQRFGHPVVFGARTLHSYPAAETLAAAGKSALRACGLGYRAKFLAGSARAVTEGILDLGVLARPEISDAEALELLCRAPGVGPKIAACVLLFAAERLGAFPVDVWVERVLRHLYADETAHLGRRDLDRFINDYFGPNRGYAQQYLFHHARLTMGRRVNGVRG